MKKVQEKKPLLKIQRNTCVWKEFGEKHFFGHVGTDPTGTPGESGTR